MTSLDAPPAARGPGRSDPPSLSDSPPGFRDLVWEARSRVALLLRLGVLASATLLVVALALEVARGTLSIPGAVGIPSWGSFVSDLAVGRTGAIVFLGLLILTLTPLARVLLSASLFAAGRDRTYTWLTTFVLLVLLLSVVAGLVS